jgi:general secretion pathway protein J
MNSIQQDARGFTLIELVISLTIVSLVAVLVYTTLDIGARAAAHGEARSIENQRARAALSLISRHLKSAYPLALQNEEGMIVYFFGAPTELSFVSGAGRPEAGGLEKITYFLREHEGRRSLWVRTSAPTLPADLLHNREGGLRQEAEVLPNVEEVAWEYLGRSQQQLNNQSQPREEWTDRWDGAKERTLPVAIRFSWKARLGALPYEWRMEVPLYVINPPPDLIGAAQGGEGAGARDRFRNRERGRER